MSPRRRQVAQLHGGPAVLAFLLWFMFVIAVWVTVIFVAVHFIRKYW